MVNKKIELERIFHNVANVCRKAPQSSHRNQSTVQLSIERKEARGCILLGVTLLGDSDRMQEATACSIRMHPFISGQTSFITDSK